MPPQVKVDVRAFTYFIVHVAVSDEQPAISHGARRSPCPVHSRPVYTPDGLGATPDVWDLRLSFIGRGTSLGSSGSPASIARHSSSVPKKHGTSDQGNSGHYGPVTRSSSLVDVSFETSSRTSRSQDLLGEAKTSIGRARADVPAHWSAVRLFSPMTGDSRWGPVQPQTTE